MTSTRSLRLGAFLTLALAASLGLSAPAHAQATKAEAKAKAKEAAKGPIDLNSATAEELQTLPGIGEVTARKIIDSRPHKSVADLSAAGVPASTIDKVKPLVVVKELPKPVDVNAAEMAELETLPGVGAVLAREIVAARPIGGYEDLGKLKGVGPEKLDGLKGRVKFGVAAVAKAKAREAVATTKEIATKVGDKIEKAADKVEAKAAVAKEKMVEKAAETRVETAKAAVKAEEKAKEKAVEAREKGETTKAKVEEAKEKVAAKIAAGAKVNINTASLETLDALPGIGPVKAAAILEARREKKFEKIEDIMNVKGIKEGEFAKIKDLITVK